MADDQEAKRKALARQRRWRAEHQKTPEFRAQRAMYRERYREKRAIYQKAWRERNREHVAAYRNKNRDHINATHRRWFAAKREVEKRQMFAAKLASPLHHAEIYAAVQRAVPRHLPSFMRDDIIADVVVMILDGEVPPDGIAAAVSAVAKRYRNEGYKMLSLDVPIFDGSGQTFLDRLTHEDLPYA